MMRHELVVLGFNLGALLTTQQHFFLLFGITTIAVIRKCLLLTLIFSAIRGLVIVSHTFLRDPKKHIEGSPRRVTDFARSP
jgi:hypothetical protein